MPWCLWWGLGWKNTWLGLEKDVVGLLRSVATNKAEKNPDVSYKISSSFKCTYVETLWEKKTQ